MARLGRAFRHEPCVARFLLYARDRCVLSQSFQRSVHADEPLEPLVVTVCELMSGDSNWSCSGFRGQPESLHVTWLDRRA